MLLEEMMKDERKAGRAEGRAEGLAEGLAKGRIETILRQLTIKGFDSLELNDKIRAISDPTLLDALTDAILTANSPEELMQLIK